MTTQILEYLLVYVHGNNVVDLAIHQCRRRLHFEHGLGVEFVDAAAAGGGQCGA
jgi:hypothetical protein